MNREKQRIIYVWNYREWGGAQIYFLSLMKEAEKSYSVTGLAPADSEPAIMQYIDAFGFSCDFLRPAPTGENPGTIFGKISRRLAMLRSENDLVRHLTERGDLSDAIIHIDLGFWQSFLPLFRLARKTNVFVTIHTALPLMRGVRGFLWRVKGRLLSRLPTFHLIASNLNARDGLKPYIPSETFDQIEVNYSGFDPGEIMEVLDNHPGKRAVVDRYGLPKDRPILVTAGQFIERKGSWILLEALRRLKREGKQFLFIWLATITPDDKTLRRIERYELGASFRLMAADEIGSSRGELLTLVSIADVFVLASLVEGLPIALVEAMALGLPCIATTVNAIPEAIKDRRSGRIVPPGNSAALAGVIGELLSDPEQRQALGIAAQKIAFHNFDSKKSAARTVKLYDEVWKIAS